MAGRTARGGGSMTFAAIESGGKGGGGSWIDAHEGEAEAVEVGVLVCVLTHARARCV